MENLNISDVELKALQNIVRLGATFVELSKDIKQSQTLSEMLVSIGEALQGI